MPTGLLGTPKSWIQGILKGCSLISFLFVLLVNKLFKNHTAVQNELKIVIPLAVLLFRPNLCMCLCAYLAHISGDAISLKISEKKMLKSS
jgi:hypothetical protein